MGQSYYVEISFNNVNEKGLMKDTLRFYQLGDDYGRTPEEMSRCTNYKSILELMFPNIHIEKDSINSCFDASYGWHCIMINWFEFCRNNFDNGTIMKIYPDEGATFVKKEDDKISVKDLDWADLVDVDEELSNAWAIIKNRLESEGYKNEDLLFEIKTALGDSRDEFNTDLDEKIGDLFDTKDDLNKFIEIINDIAKSCWKH